MKSKSIFLFVIILNSIIFSQVKEPIKNSFLLSLKAGYHTEYNPEQNNGFPGGFVWDAAFSYGINNFLTIGVNLEGWNKKNIYKPHIGNEDISAIAYSINCKYWKSIFKSLDLYLGAGFGSYSIKRKYSIPGNDKQENYLNLFILFGTDIWVYKNFFISAECNLTGLIGGIDYGGNKSDPAFINYKVGPTFFIQLK